MDDLGRAFADLLTALAKLATPIEAVGRPPERELIRRVSALDRASNDFSERPYAAPQPHLIDGGTPAVVTEDINPHPLVSIMLTTSELEVAHGQDSNDGAAGRTPRQESR